MISLFLLFTSALGLIYSPHFLRVTEGIRPLAVAIHDKFA